MTPHELADALRGNLNAVIQGKAELVERVLTALFAGGNVLLEDVPGVGKTTLAKALAVSLGGEFRRIQFTPDMLPADILGGSIFSPKTGEFTFREGPVFCNVLLADEINRASPRTQSALLEAMTEGQASVEGMTRTLPRPFLVLATQNPVEYHGTYPLPEAQLDRFLMLLKPGYPDSETELAILYAQQKAHPLARLKAVATPEAVLKAQEAVQEIHVEESVGRYVVNLTRATREDDRVRLGASPRAALMLFRAAQAAALLRGRDFVTPDDALGLAPAVLGHRLVLDGSARYSGLSAEGILGEIINRIPVPA
jgi:MoxR-like ATPase